VTAGNDDLVIRVRLDTTQAKAEWKKQEDAAKSLGSSGGFGMSKMLGGAAGAAAMAILGPTIMDYGKAALNPLHNMMRATVGAPAKRILAGQNAEAEAMAETAEMFAPFGEERNAANKARILTMYDANLRYKQREALGRNKAEEIISGERMDRDLQAVTDVLVKSLMEVADHIKSTFGGGGRPTIK